jgi:hypothetical protein
MFRPDELLEDAEVAGIWGCDPRSIGRCPVETPHRDRAVFAANRNIDVAANGKARTDERVENLSRGNDHS